MKETFFVKNQKQLDNILKNKILGDYPYIKIDSKEKILIKTDKPYIFITLNKTVLECFGKATIQAYGKSRVEAFDNCIVYAYENSFVRGNDYSSVELQNQTSGIALNFSKFFVKDNSKVILNDYSNCLSKNNSRVESRGFNKIESWHKSDIKSISKNMEIDLFEKSTFSGDGKVNDFRKDFYSVNDFLNLCHKIDADNFLLFKSIRQDGTDFFTTSIQFKFGENICEDFDEDPSKEFSRGFHLSRTPLEALSYHPSGDIIRAKVHKDDMVILNSDYTKIRCRKFIWI
jgi:hypothetical protein